VLGRVSGSCGFECLGVGLGIECRDRVDVDVMNCLGEQFWIVVITSLD
jgi:hypothetical protein